MTALRASAVQTCSGGRLKLVTSFSKERLDKKEKKRKQHHSKETTQQSAEWRCIWMRAGLQFLLSPFFLVGDLFVLYTLRCRSSLCCSTIKKKKKRDDALTERGRSLLLLRFLTAHQGRKQTVRLRMCSQHHGCNKNCRAGLLPIYYTPLTGDRGRSLFFQCT